MATRHAKAGKGSRVRRHYLKHDYAEEKQAAWDRLGDYLLTLIQAA